jgi:hypothetical protein
MARPERMTLEVLTAPGTGKPENVFRLRDKTVQISGPFGGSLQLEGSVDGEDFEPIGAPLTGPGFVLVPMAVAFLRMNTLELTSGLPKAVMAGFDFRAV